MQNPSNETLKNILQNAKTIAVVGLSDKPERTSYQIAENHAGKWISDYSRQPYSR